MAVDALAERVFTSSEAQVTKRKASIKQRSINGDLNNTSTMRFVEPPVRNPAFAFKSLALSASEDDPAVRTKHRPFLLSEELMRTDWISKLELATATEMAHSDLIKTGSRLKVLILYGSLRKR